ncbi:HpcH/HpaI aldolase/citrate lyase family protein [Sphingomonas sp. HT-1]|uniref:HpcH/HpaI aldolase/citrate lyase family protein n=1 Tax=unclassified Sphingomonas TaxID=196159 RepID=UPI0002EEBA49|nr:MULTISPECIES: CoA ester lyase [unclassified Sphingomonas]KTF69535.1 citrate lyase [Sphingomonas sp. WG]
MKLRSLLFVPGDRPERFAKAAASGADALILDCEDSVVATRKPFAREAIAEWLAAGPSVPSYVRINPLGSDSVAADLAAVLPHRPAGLVLPKAEGAASIERLLAAAGEACPPILPIATETPAALFQLGSYAAVTRHLVGLSWGAEDLPAAIGASAAREPDGSYTAPFAMVRALALFGAHAAGVAAIETVYPDTGDADGLAAYVARGRRDGFTGMLAIHPNQIPAINSGFTPSDSEIAAAKAIVAAFAANPEAGALKLDGRMIDRPHLEQARRLLARAEV